MDGAALIRSASRERRGVDRRPERRAVAMETTTRRRGAMSWAGPARAAGKRQVIFALFPFSVIFFYYLTERGKQLIEHPFHLGKIWEGSH
jgi:ribosomal protein L27